MFSVGIFGYYENGSHLKAHWPCFYVSLNSLRDRLLIFCLCSASHHFLHQCSVVVSSFVVLGAYLQPTSSASLMSFNLNSICPVSCAMFQHRLWTCFVVGIRGENPKRNVCPTSIFGFSPHMLFSRMGQEEKVKIPFIIY